MNKLSAISLVLSALAMGGFNTGITAGYAAPKMRSPQTPTTNSKHRRGIPGGLYQGNLGAISHSKGAHKKRRAAANRDFNIAANGTVKLKPYNNRAASTGIANAHLGANKGNRWAACAVTKRCPGRGIPKKSSYLLNTGSY